MNNKFITTLVFGCVWFYFERSFFSFFLYLVTSCVLSADLITPLILLSTTRIHDYFSYRGFVLLMAPIVNDSKCGLCSSKQSCVLVRIWRNDRYLKGGGRMM